MNESVTTARPTSIGDVAGRVAAVSYETSDDLHAILSAAVDALRARGISVAGLLQRSGEPLVNGKPSMWVDDIGSGQAVRLDEPRGPGAIACTFNTDALARAAWLLRLSVESGADVIFASRFGSMEAEGGGMRSEIADAICRGSLVVIPVRNSILPDLETFLGMQATVVVAAPGSIADWAVRAVATRDRSSFIAERLS